MKSTFPLWLIQMKIFKMLFSFWGKIVDWSTEKINKLDISVNNPNFNLNKLFHSDFTNFILKYFYDSTEFLLESLIIMIIIVIIIICDI